ncbi:hypothetical protein PR001_g24328 [Phytophthora rubi]|uniref:RxLR effector protein n=1 Tax=Phytophthora rubi TaxID=129364 RepID=A0A6A3IJH4_9STRA|nr:hypothetical protein PR001_g24328 [Phytophthora rubi]
MRVTWLVVATTTILLGSGDATTDGVNTTSADLAATGHATTDITRRLLSFDDGSSVTHEATISKCFKGSLPSEKASPVEEERMAGMAGAAAGARGGGTTTVVSGSDEPRWWTKFKARWKGLFKKKSDKPSSRRLARSCRV